MKQKISALTFILGLALVISSFALRESYEKDMYQLYINQQKDNLVKGWEKSWQDFLINNYLIEKDKNTTVIKVDRTGKLVDKEFFPMKSKVESNWEKYKSYNLDSKKSFLKDQLKKSRSWDRAMAIKKLALLDKNLLPSQLSTYEKTLIEQEIKESVRLIFTQLKDGREFSDINDKYIVDNVLIRSEKNAEISLTVPSQEYLHDLLFKKFKEEANVSEIELTTNPFKIQIKKNFNPFKLNSVREKIMMGLGFALLFVAVGVYLLELKNKRLEILKKVSFLNQLVHEVKTPITGIRLNSELLLKHGHDEELINALMKSSKRLNDFFEDIILINKNNRNIIISELKREDFKDYINEILSEFKGCINASIEVKDSIFLDRSRLRIILRNLLKNAVRYGRKGQLKIAQDNHHIVFYIQDEGPGISINDSNKIFQEFYRAKSAKNSSPDGLGIGLSIVKNLVTQIGGTIELKNPGKEHALFELRIKNES